MLKTISKLLVATALVLPVAAHATIFQFTSSLSGANEVPASGAPGSGSALLNYDDAGTAATGDDTYNFILSVFGLTSPVSGYHIHGPGTTAQNVGVLVNLQTNPSFTTAVNAGGTLVVFGNNVAPPSATFLGTLLGGLTYVNVHTTANPGGAIRGQLLQVAVVPEPETYGMLLAGLALIGTVVGRRKSKT